MYQWRLLRKSERLVGWRPWKWRQGAKFYGKIGTDEALPPGEENLIGRTLGEIGRGWIGNYDPDYFKD